MTPGGLKFFAERARAYLLWPLSIVQFATFLIVAKLPWWELAILIVCGSVILAVILIWDYKRGFRQEQTVQNRILVDQIGKVVEDAFQRHKND